MSGLILFFRWLFTGLFCAAAFLGFVFSAMIYFTKDAEAQTRSQSAPLQVEIRERNPYRLGIPYDFTRFPNIDINVDPGYTERPHKCTACILEQYYYSLEPEQQAEQERLMHESNMKLNHNLIGR